MKCSAVNGKVNTESVRQLTLTVEVEDDAVLLGQLLHLFRFPRLWSEAHRLAFAVLCTTDATVTTALLDEVAAEYQARDAGENYVSRWHLLQALLQVDEVRREIMRLPADVRAAEELKPLPVRAWNLCERAVALAVKAKPKAVPTEPLSK